MCINVHPATPEYPGMGGLNWAIYNRSNSFGVTVHLMNEIIDNGRILDVIPVKIFDNDTVESLSIRLQQVRTKIVQNIVTSLKNSSFLDFVSSFSSSNYKWSQRVYYARELDEMQLINLNDRQDLSGLLQHLRAFHTPRFPVKFMVDGKIYSFTCHE